MPGRVVIAALVAALVVSVTAPAAPMNPELVPLVDLAAIRGAMWSARYPMRQGPRPNQPSNILALAAIGGEAPEVRAKALRSYAGRGYTHGVVGAWQPAGFSPYRDVYPKQTPSFDQYLDLLQEFWDHGIKPVVFIKPDGWTCTQLESLTPFYQQPRAQRLVRIAVPGGWEPSKSTTIEEWECWTRWGRQVLPRALSLVHMEADEHGTASLWNRIAPMVHGYLVQNGGYVFGGSEQPTAEFVTNFADQFRLNPKPGAGSLMDRFTWGYAGWPTSSAWGEGVRIRVYAGEYAAYGNFWWDWDERYARQLGDAAIRAGADGYLDGGTVRAPKFRAASTERK